jgi:hypothetical protein
MITPADGDNRRGCLSSSKSAHARSILRSITLTQTSESRQKHSSVRSTQAGTNILSNSNANFPKVHTREGNRRVFHVRASASCQAATPIHTAPLASQRREVHWQPVRQTVDHASTRVRAKRCCLPCPLPIRHSPTAVS